MKVFVLLMVSLLLGGCQPYGLLSPDDSALYEPPEPRIEVPEATAGGLLRAGQGNSLVRDRRAGRLGDIVTVLLNEATQSSKSAGTSFDKSSDLSVGIPNVLGKQYDRLESSASASRGFEGTASSSQQNVLRGSISVVVHRVLPDGTLVVRGEKVLQLNQGDEIIRLSGLVRPDDIDRHNQVSSQRVANARVSYAGRGALADSNAAGWLTRFFNSPWFPL